MVAQLPSVVVAAFQSPRDIRENWGVKLYQLCRNDSPEHLLTRRARALANKPSGLSGPETYERLTTDSAMKRGHGYRRNRSVPVLGTTGEMLFREHEQIDTVVFIVPKTKLTDRTRDALRQAMVHILELETAPSHEHSASMHKL